MGFCTVSTGTRCGAAAGASDPPLQGPLPRTHPPAASAPGGWKDIRAHTRALLLARDQQHCTDCQLHSPRATPRSPLIPLPIIDVPLKRIGLDIVGPLPKSIYTGDSGLRHRNGPLEDSNREDSRTVAITAVQPGGDSRGDPYQSGYVLHVPGAPRNVQTTADCPGSHLGVPLTHRRTVSWSGLIKHSRGCSGKL